MLATTRTARRTLRDRTRTTRAQARITRNGAASLSTYGVAAGLGIKAARSVASALRDKAKALHLVGTAHRTHSAGRMRTGQRYTPAQVVLMALAYKPRKAEYRTARAHLLLAA